MANADKVVRGQVYLAQLEQRLKSNTVPQKHAKSEESKKAYRNWLETEIVKAKIKLEEYRAAAATA